MGGVEYPSPHIFDGESIVIVGLANGFGVGSGSGADAHPPRTTATTVVAIRISHRVLVGGRRTAPR
jgi:hypothetical protein